MKGTIEKSDKERPAILWEEPLPRRTVASWWYAVLFAVLVVPFLLREVSGQLEMYPAVLFPVGALTAGTSDTLVTYPRYEIFAVMADSSAEPIPPGRFMGNIPAQYFTHLADSRFGLIEPTYRTRWTNWFGKDRKWTAEERERTLDWLASRAEKAGHPDAVVIRVRRSIKTTDTRTGMETGSEVRYSYDIALHDR